MNPQQDEASSSYPPPPLTASPSYIGTKAKEILATREITRITKLVTNLCYGKETEQSPSSKLLYTTFTNHFPNILTLKLIQLYKLGSVSPKIRSFSLSLLDSLLIYLEDSGIFLELGSLSDIKTNLDSCLLQQEISDHEFKLLSRIISRVSVESFLNNIPWEELCAYMISLDMNKKALLIFSDLPIFLDDEFLDPLLENSLLLKIKKGLMNQDCDDEEWCVALEAGFGLLLQLMTLGEKDMAADLVYVIVNSVVEMVNVRGREIVVRKELVKLARKVRSEASRFRAPEFEIVSTFALMMQKINGVSEITVMAAKMIHEALENRYIAG